MITRPLLVKICVAVLATLSLSGCEALGHLMCVPDCESSTRQSSSLVGFLYPDGHAPPSQNEIPQLRVPLRVGLAFLPSGTNDAPSAAQREELLSKIRERFASRKFINEIVIVPDYYLKNARGFDGLQGVQRLYNADLMALVSYDQVSHSDDNSWSLGYLTIVGAYVLKGSRHEIATLVDLAVVDAQTRTLVLRAGGTDQRHGNTTLVDERAETRAAKSEGFDAATNELIAHFDTALTQFEADVKAGKAAVRVVDRQSGKPTGGGGSVGVALITLLALLVAVHRVRLFRKRLKRHRMQLR